MTRLLRLTLAASLPALAACFDGYPTEDGPVIDPARMSQAELLAELNALGRETDPDRRWRYGLHAPCELEVKVRGDGTARHRVELDGAAVTTRSVDGATEIRLVPEGAGHEQAVTVLETRRWPDTVLARSILTQLELRCGQDRAPAG